MEDKKTAGRFERSLIGIWGALLFAAVGLNAYLIASSKEWLMRLVLFFFFLLPSVYAIYILFRKEKVSEEGVE